MKQIILFIALCTITFNAMQCNPPKGSNVVVYVGETSNGSLHHKERLSHAQGETAGNFCACCTFSCLLGAFASFSKIGIIAAESCYQMMYPNDHFTTESECLEISNSFASWTSSIAILSSGVLIFACPASFKSFQNYRQLKKEKRNEK